MKQMRHIGVSLSFLWISLLSVCPALAQPGAGLQPFTAEYQLSRGRMLIGKVTNRLQIDADGSYSYTSITKPVGIVAAFSDDLITETSRGRIVGGRVIPSSYVFDHKRKKRPKLRKQQFDWSTHKLTSMEPKPAKSIDIPDGAQDKASMVLALMQMMPPNSRDIRLQVADKSKLKEYLMSAQGKEQIQSNGASYEGIKLTDATPGQKPDTTFWLAPALNYLPVQIEKVEKKDTYTMTLMKYTAGQPAASTN